jgi:gliding motility-associated-like protein
MQIGDVFYVYDGPTANSTNLIGSYTTDGIVQQLLPGDTLQPSTSNTSGCLTFIFVSDNDNKTDLGWGFDISCFVPCQNIVGVGTFNGIIAEDSIFRFCRGEVMDLAGLGIYPDMGTPRQLYVQNNELSTFTWNIEGPTPGTATGTFNPATGFSETTYTFADSGIYHLILEIQDTLTEFECKNRNYVHNIVYVSGPPLFTAASPADTTLAEFQTICLGDPNYLVGIVDTFFHVDECTPVTGESVLIPDGADAGGLETVEIEAEFKCYGKQTITAASDIESICIDMEHSSIGDLEMFLTCPSGQTVRFLLPDPLQRADLGSPILTGTAHGTDSTYCFSMNGLETLNQRASGLSAVQVVSTDIALPIDGFENFVGCRINGKWILSVKDRLINDNGYAGNWEISFGSNIQPVSDTLFYNTYLDSNWIEDPTNPSLGINLTPLSKGDTLVVLPTAIGNYNYTFQVLDNFGCTYDTTVSFMVVDRRQADFTYLGDTVYCEGETALLTPVFLPGFNNRIGQAGVFASVPAGLTVNSTTGQLNINASTPSGSYTITNTVITNPGPNQCIDVHEFGTIVIYPRPQPTILGGGDYCQTATLTIQPGATDAPYNSTVWSEGSTTVSIDATSANNPITVTVTDTNGCVGVSPAVTVNSTAQVEHIDSVFICEGSSALIHGVIRTLPGVYSEVFSLGITTCDSVSTITLAYFPEVNIGPDVTICEGTCTTLVAGGIDPLNANYTWSNGIFGSTQTVCPIINTQYSVVATDGNGCVTRDTVMVIVNPIRDIALNYSLGTICLNSPSPTPTFNAQAGYLFTSVPANVDPITGLLTSTATAGDVTITYSDNLYGCDINNTATITITTDPDATFTYDPICVPGTSACPVFPAGASAGVFSFLDPATTGIVMNTSTGCIDLTASNAGTYTVVNTIAANGTCPEVSHQFTFNINDKPIVSGTTSNSNFCVGDCATLTGSSNSSNPMSYSWDNGVTDQVQFCPPSSQTYTVTGTDLITTCSNTAIVSVIVNQLPVIDPITSSLICRGQSATINAFSPTSLIENVSYNWDNGLGSGSSKTVSPLSSTTYTVTVINNTTFCENSASVTVNVNQPIIDAGPDVSICSGNQANLNATGAASYTWSPATLLTNSGISNPSTVITGTQTFGVTGTDVNGCTFTDFVTVTVNSLPNVSAVAAPTNVCLGQATTITASGADSYTGFTGNTLSFTAPSSGVVNVPVIGTDANGCQNTFNVPITVIALPVINVTPIAPVCAGSSVTLFASSTGNTISWNNGVVNGVSFTAASSNNYIVTATSPAPLNCVNTQTVPVVVNPLPNVQASVNDDTPCEGDLVTFTGSGAGVGATYLWNNGIIDGQPLNITGTTGIIILTGIDANGCSNTDDVTVTVNPNPQVLVQAVDSSICIGNIAYLSATPGFVNYQWSPNGSGESFEDTPGIGTNKYTVVVTDANGCTATDDLDVIVVPNNVLAVFTAAENSNVINDNVVYPGSEVIFTNTSLNSNSYIWDLKDGNGLFTTTSKGNQSATYTAEGVYYVYLQASNTLTGCVDDTVLQITVVPFDGAIVCNPNIFTPNEDKQNDVFYVEICSGLVEKLEVVVYNRWGNQIHSMSGVYDPADPKTYWDGTQNGKPVSEGVYFYTFEAVGKNGDVVKGHDNVQVVRDK